MAKIAYDIDGVLAVLCKRDKPYSKQNKAERERFEKERVYYYGNSPLLMCPKEPFYIISARKKKYTLISDEWIKKNKLNVIASFYFDGGRNFEEISKFKIEKLKELKIDKFYEDDPKLIREIKKHLPKLEIVHIKRDKTNVRIVDSKQTGLIKLF